jgi:hypothetical protein
VRSLLPSWATSCSMVIAEAMKVPLIMHDACKTVAIRVETMDANVPMQIHVTDMVERGKNNLAMRYSCISNTSGRRNRDSSEALARWKAGTPKREVRSARLFHIWLLSAARRTHAQFVRRMRSTLVQSQIPS